MMTETQRRIRAYKRALPALRERVIAVALLLAMSASMLTSASFAWLTLSRAPEATGMTTTVAANGNLEIALATGKVSDGLVPPGESKAGDSSAAENQTIVGSNVTWGNLVNLSDPKYGLNYLALRPALLSDRNLDKYPLYGATYGGDGRVISTSEQYEYASWTTNEQSGESYFDARDVQYGVRAISSIQYTNVTGDAAMGAMWTEITEAYTSARNSYSGIVEGDTLVDEANNISCMDALSSLLETFAQERADNVLDTSGTVIYADYSGHVTYFYRIMEEFMKVLQNEGTALLNLANLQAYLDDSARGTMAIKSLEELLALSNTQLEDYGIQLESLATFKTNYNLLHSDLNGPLKQLSEDCDPATTTSPEKVLWTDIDDTVNHFVDISTATLDGMEIQTMGSDDLGTLVGIALTNSQRNPSTVVIKAGILKDSEQRLGNRMEDKGIMVSIHINALGLNKNVYALVETTAEAPYHSVTDQDNTEELQGGTAIKGEDPVAKDTYGMAIDVWLRTNAANSVVTLEGQTLFTQVDVYDIDKDGNSTQIFIMTPAEGESQDVYSLDDTYYYANTHQEVEEDVLTGAAFEAKTRDEVIGYQGENRVWEEWQSMINAGLIQEDNTTQGAGSCFVFYANPTEKENILELLDSFCIAFIDSQGEELGRAILNTNNAYAINGKVTVPLEMITGTDYVTEDESGREVTLKGIAPLAPNEPKLITAVVYLDGMRLKNENVLSSGEIQGQLNLQFGSSVALNSVEDRELQEQYRTITAVATSGDQTSYNAEDSIEFEYDGNAKTVRVTLTVDGEQPSSVSGFFVRTINDTQGTREESEIFTKADDGTWYADFDLTSPGTYLLRSLIVDGAEYTLDAFPSVSISGRSISRITSSLQSGSHMTAGNSLDVTVTAQINADPALMPKQVRAVFRGTNGKEYNAIMSYDQVNNEWSGTASINVSGTYVLQYLVMDGMYTDVPEGSRTTLVISLGMTSQVWADLTNTGLTSTEFEFRNEVTIPMQVKISDNGGAEKRNLDGVMELYYWAEGSSLDQNGLHAVMTWNAGTGYYEGDFKVSRAGRYSFNRITITSDEGSISTIRNTASSPQIVAIPPDPPAYIRSGMAEEGYDAYQVNFDGTAKLSVYMAYAEAAIVSGKIVDQNGNSHVVQGHVLMDDKETVTVNGNAATAYRFEFTIPHNADGNQNGEWQLTELYFQNVFVDMTPGDNDDTMTQVPVTEGVLPTDDGNSYVMDVPDNAEEDKVKAYVVAKPKTTFTKAGSTDTYTGDSFGGTLTNRTGMFMETHTVEPVTLTVLDWADKPIEGLTGVTWHITYDGKSNDYGGYTGAAESPRAIAMVDDGTHSTFTAPAQTFTYAGGYTTSVELSFDKTVSHSQSTYPLTEYRPKITVISKVPTVTIDSISPSGTHTSVNSNTQQVTVTSKIDGNTVTIYPAGTTSTNCGTTTANITTQPTVTLELTGLGNADSATLSFTSDASDGTVRLYASSGSGQTTAYTWAADGNVTRHVGYYANGCSDAVAAGTLTSSNMLVLTVGEDTYTVAVSVITIINVAP